MSSNVGFAAMILMFFSCILFASPGFYPLDFLENYEYARVTGVSNNGITAGYVQNGGWTRAVYWYGQQLYQIDQRTGYVKSRSNDISADGSTIVGNGITSEGFYYQNENLYSVRFANSNHDYSIASAVSSDGSIIAGQSYKLGVLPSEGFSWQDGNMNTLGNLFNLIPRCMPYSISGNGGVIVGKCVAGGSNEAQQAFRWENGQMLGLGYLKGHNLSVAYDVSTDGSTIVGRSSNRDERISSAFMWKNGEMLSLDSSGSYLHSEAWGISSDSEIIVGHFTHNHQRKAFIWDSENGMQSLSSFLINEYNFDLQGWTLSEAMAISDNGRFIVGNGIDPLGNDGAWMIEVPEPCSLMIICLLLCKP